MPEELITQPELPVEAPRAERPIRRKRAGFAAPIRLTSQSIEDDHAQRSAELFYLQKQIQTQTPMVIVLEDGERIEGCIEWYDRHSLKVRGRAKALIYKPAIKYMFKQGESRS